MLNNFTIDIYHVVLTTQIKNSIVSILSTQADKIELPQTNLSNDNLLLLDNMVNETLLKYLVINRMELLPQIISLHSNAIPSKNNNSLNVVYGCLVDENTQVRDAYWVNLDYINPSDPYAKLVIEVMQRVQ